MRNWEMKEFGTRKWELIECGSRNWEGLDCGMRIAECGNKKPVAGMDESGPAVVR